jgi:hypothetical protein
MVRGKGTKGMVMLLLFVVTASAKSEPTANDRASGAVGCVLSSSTHAQSYHRPERSCITGLCDSHLAASAAEFHKPSVRFAGPPVPPIGIESLSLVLGTLLMILLGFLCVSLVRDRRFWLAALAGLLWAGRTGLSFLPPFGFRLAGKRHSEQESSSHHVARSYERRHPCRVSFAQTRYRLGALQSAITTLSSLLIHAANGLAPGSGQPVYFEAASIVTDSARGPPYSVRIANFLLRGVSAQDPLSCRS